MYSRVCGGGFRPTNRSVLFCTSSLSAYVLCRVQQSMREPATMRAPALGRAVVCPPRTPSPVPESTTILLQNKGHHRKPIVWHLAHSDIPPTGISPWVSSLRANCRSPCPRCERRLDAPAASTVLRGGPSKRCHRLWPSACTPTVISHE